MRFRFLRYLALPILLLSALTSHAQHGKTVSLWLSNADRSALFAEQSESLRFQKSSSALPVIEINDKQK